MTSRPLRCAVYTRVSSDAGLEQDFNSLDAQRESAEAYIKSQAHEGWRMVRDRFDDGGFSGGSMERPALQKLLDHIRQRRIDIVVVYKVDRLTRALADFAKLVELFDTHKVSFVSVTQAFNTTNSMGRLTLNVLLSFAQFEREVTSERIRDKIAASKRKGMWMGGVVPHGYRVVERKLHIVEAEAAEVRQIFDLYLAHGSIRAVQRELRAQGVRTRKRALATGRVIGGIFFTNGPLDHMLRNRHYIGEINHKGRSWPGEHAAIVDRAIFDQVQEKLVGKRRARVANHEKSRALLLGRLFNDAGERMTPTYAVKNGVRYRYYISVSAMQSRARTSSSVHRVHAESIETAVIDALQDARRAQGEMDGRRCARSADRTDATKDIPHNPTTLPHPGSDATRRARILVDERLARAVVHPDHIEIVWRDGAEAASSARTTIVPWIRPSLTRRREILEPTAASSPGRLMEADERDRLIRAIALARKWLGELIAGAIPDPAALAAREHKSERSIRMTLSLAFLDPALIAAAVDGRLPRGYGVSRLVDLPPAFDDQWRALGLARPA